MRTIILVGYKLYYKVTIYYVFEDKYRCLSPPALPPDEAFAAGLAAAGLAAAGFAAASARETFPRTRMLRNRRRDSKPWTGHGVPGKKQLAHPNPYHESESLRNTAAGCRCERLRGCDSPAACLPMVAQPLAHLPPGSDSGWGRACL